MKMDINVFACVKGEFGQLKELKRLDNPVKLEVEEVRYERVGRIHSYVQRMGHWG